MDEKYLKQLEALEREKRAEEIKLNQDKVKFAALIKQVGNEKLAMNQLIKQPNRFKIFITNIKRVIKRIFDTL